MFKTKLATNRNVLSGLARLFYRVCIQYAWANGQW